MTDPFDALAERWAHGHDELTDDCALCYGEYAEAVALAHDLLGGKP